ncbi:MAG: DeoR/GlpR family DNA-binding transcription regulator [Sphaerochaetaceae bacterium]|nr:DeoR/GlpR family DNA-binding transcription regulator [Sphaerochaetaceae bacterium]
MSKNEDRRALEMSIILEKGFVSIKDLAETLKVSEMTVRRDINTISKNSNIRQVYGGVASSTPSNVPSYSLNQELDKNILRKKNIAKMAYSLVNPNDFIFIDSGTTTRFITDFITEKDSLRVLSTAYNSISSLVENNNCQIICPGGVYSNDSRNFFSDDTIKFIEKYRANKCFIGATGFDLKFGLTCSYPSDVQIKKALMDSSLEKYLLIDSSKFNLVSSCVFDNIKQFNAIITDTNIPIEYKKYFEENKISLLIA